MRDTSIDSKGFAFYTTTLACIREVVLTIALWNAEEQPKLASLADPEICFKPFDGGYAQLGWSYQFRTKCGM
jgi:hypothetical protein